LVGRQNQKKSNKKAGLRYFKPAFLCLSFYSLTFSSVDFFVVLPAPSFPAFSW
tara:strand:+ start:581 stop:739 length:159 start_codon:yes stop_codon:yes gene_type:complete